MNRIIFILSGIGDAFSFKNGNKTKLNILGHSHVLIKAATRTQSWEQSVRGKKLFFLSVAADERKHEIFGEVLKHREKLVNIISTALTNLKSKFYIHDYVENLGI